MQTELEPVSASPEQLATANLLFYTHLVTAIDHQARNYARFRINNLGGNEEEYRTQAQTALEDLYFAGEDPEKLTNFENDWGESAEFFRNQLNRIAPQLEKKKHDFSAKAPSLGFTDRLKLGYTLGKKLTSDLASEQKSHILEMAGYSKEERHEILKKLAISAGLNTISTVVYTGTAAALTIEGSQNLDSNQINNANLQLATILSYAAHYCALAVNSVQNLRMLNHQRIHNSTNVAATAFYYLLEKLMPNKDLRNSTATLAFVIPFVVFEAAWLAAADAGRIDLGAQIGRNAALAALYSADSGIIESYINGKENKK